MEKEIRTLVRNPKDQVNPHLFSYGTSLFAPNGAYGKYGYLDSDSKS